MSASKTKPVTTHTYTLTMGTDAIVATQDNNVFNAYVDLGDKVDPANDLVSTFTAGDSLTGFGANNVLNFTSDDGALPTGVTVTGIQTVDIIANGAYTADVSKGWTGLVNLDIRETWNAPVTVNSGALDLNVTIGTDLSGLSGHATAATLIGSGTVHLNAGSLSSLKSVDASAFTGTAIADLTGDRSSYTGGAGNDIVMIDRAPTKATMLDGGTGDNSLQVGADHLSVLTEASMAFVHNFPTLLVSSGFTAGQPLDFSAVAPFFSKISVVAGAADLGIIGGPIVGALAVSCSGSLTLNAAHASLLASIDASAATGTVTADLSGDFLSYQGGSGNDIVTIDGSSVITLDGGAGANSVQIGADQFVQLPSTSLSHVTHVQTLAIAGGFTQGMVLNAAPLLSGFNALVLSGGITDVTLNAAHANSLTSVDVSGMSGAVTADLTGDDVSYKGGSGNDTVTINRSPTGMLDGGAGTNVLNVDLSGLTGTFDWSHVTNFTVNLINDTGSSTLPAITVDLSGSNANFQGGSEADIVMIDHAPVGQTIDGGASGPVNTLELIGDQIDLGVYTASALSGVKHFGSWNIAGTFLDGKIFDAAPLASTVTLFEISGQDAVTGPDARGITIVNAASSMHLEIVSTPGAPITFDGASAATIELLSPAQGKDVTASVVNHTATSVSIQNFEQDLFNATNHLKADFTKATSLSITGFANLDMSGSSLANVVSIDDSSAHGTLTIDIGAANETIKIGFGGAILGSAVAGTMVDFGVTSVAETNATATLGAASAADITLTASLNGAMTAKGHVSWFLFGGNTYIVEDVSNGHAFSAGTDMMVELTGVHDLTNAQFTSTHAITI